MTVVDQNQRGMKKNRQSGDELFPITSVNQSLISISSSKGEGSAE